MLARTYRLRKNSDFQRLYRTAKRFATPNLVLYYTPSHLKYSQVGFVVSKKVSKSAVVRNTLRRRASGVVEEMFANIKEPVKMIVLIRKDFSGMNPIEIKAEINKLLERLVA